MKDMNNNMMKNNILESKQLNLDGNLASVKLQDQTIVSKAEMIKNIKKGKETYSYDNHMVSVISDKWIRLDGMEKESVEDVEMDDLGSLKVGDLVF